MPNDAKLGLVVGVGLVIVVAVAFFRQEAGNADTAATIVKPAPVPTPLPPPPPARKAFARATTWTPPATAAGRRHTVEEGDTLFSLAQRYYGDGDKSAVIYQVNRNRLSSPDDLPPGTVLIIPDLPEE